MKINKFTKKKNGMYDISFEGGRTITAHEDIILKYELLIKKELTEELEQKIEKENITYIAYDLAIKYITKKMRCKKELKEYLSSKEVDLKEIEKVIEILEKNGYLNEEIYVESFINDKIILSNDGPNKIRKELQTKGINTKTIEEKIVIFEKEQQIEKINKIITKIIKSNKNKSTYILKNKIIDYLSNLGYEKSLILDLLSNFELEDSKDLIKKEYDKIYKKLSKKYSGKELEYKVKQKMYSLGFQNYYVE
ncbi:MAG: RecX family transcriptional regulator [Bacilli bacterium]|nr:RecX family transcriptional regulator [Bacilli bacterium]